MARPSLAERLVESVPNVSEGRRLEVVELLATAISSVDGVHLLDRTSDASHNRSVFTIAGRRAPSARPRAARCGRDPRDDWSGTGASTPGSGPRRHPVGPPRRHDDGQTVELARAFGQRIAGA
jgi:glutamate formiminotransferase